jgi:hypothetical protein
VRLPPQITTGQFNPALNNADFHERGDIGFLIPQYVFNTPFGQAAVAVAGLYGHNQAALTATFSATPIPIFQTVALNDTTLGFSDLIPQFSLRWTAGMLAANVAPSKPCSLCAFQSGRTCKNCAPLASPARVRP